MANIVKHSSQNLSPFGMFDDLDRLMDSMLGNLRLTVQPSGRFNSMAFNPQLDVHETDTGIEVAAELPGLNPEDVQLDVTNNILTIQGEKKYENEVKGKTAYRSERSYGSFTRRIALPAEVDTDKVEATFKNGILNISLPKTEKSQPKQISIKAS